MTWKFCVTYDELELLTDLFLYSWFHHSVLYDSEKWSTPAWLESSIESDLSKQFALKKATCMTCLLILVIQEKCNFDIWDSLFFPLVDCARDPPFILYFYIWDSHKC